MVRKLLPVGQKDVGQHGGQMAFASFSLLLHKEAHIPKHAD